MDNQAEADLAEKLRKRKRLEKLEKQIESRRMHLLLVNKEQTQVRSPDLRLCGSLLHNQNLAKDDQERGPTRKSSEESKAPSASEFESHPAVPEKVVPRTDNHHLQELAQPDPLISRHNNRIFIKERPLHMADSDCQGYSVRSKVNDHCSSILNSPAMWQPLTIVVIPDVFLDPSCYIPFNSLSRQLGDGTQLRIITLASYSRYETTRQRLGFVEDIQQVRRVLQEELDRHNRDVIIIGHGYGTLVGSSACSGMIRIPKDCSSGHSRRVPSVQGIVSISGWILDKGTSIILGGPLELFDFRLRSVCPILISLISFTNRLSIVYSSNRK
jgi:hypothetical protein